MVRGVSRSPAHSFYLCVNTSLPSVPCVCTQHSSLLCVYLVCAHNTTSTHNTLLSYVCTLCVHTTLPPHSKLFPPMCTLCVHTTLPPHSTLFPPLCVPPCTTLCCFIVFRITLPSTQHYVPHLCLTLQCDVQMYYAPLYMSPSPGTPLLHIIRNTVMLGYVTSES